MSSTTCPSCESLVAAGNVFCGNCGTRVVVRSESVETQAGQPGARADATATVEVPSSAPSAETTAAVSPTPPIEAAAPVPPTSAAETTAPVTAAVPATVPVEQTLTQEVEPEAPRSLRADPRRLVLLAVMVAILSFIGRVAYLTFTAGPQQEGEIVAQLPVGPDGGSAKFDDGGEVRVPDGALKERRTLTVRKNTVRDRIRALSPGGEPLIVPSGTQVIYLFGPADIVFHRPVTIVLPVAQGRPVAFVFSNGQIRFIEGDVNRRTVTIRVNGFDFTRPGTIIG